MERILGAPKGSLEFGTQDFIKTIFEEITMKQEQIPA